MLNIDLDSAELPLSWSPVGTADLPPRSPDSEVQNSPSPAREEIQPDFDGADGHEGKANGHGHGHGHGHGTVVRLPTFTRKRHSGVVLSTLGPIAIAAVNVRDLGSTSADMDSGWRVEARAERETDVDSNEEVSSARLVFTGADHEVQRGAISTYKAPSVFSPQEPLWKKPDPSEQLWTGPAKASSSPAAFSAANGGRAADQVRRSMMPARLEEADGRGTGLSAASGVKLSGFDTAIPEPSEPSMRWWEEPGRVFRA
eukprot:2297173-Rhodomonas_salina.1